MKLYNYNWKPKKNIRKLHFSDNQNSKQVTLTRPIIFFFQVHFTFSDIAMFNNRYMYILERKIHNLINIIITHILWQSFSNFYLCKSSSNHHTTIGA